MRIGRQIVGVASVVVAVGVLASCREAVSTKTAAEEVHEGWRHFQLEEFDKAGAAFQAAVGKADVTAALRINATYGLGMVASLGHHGEQSEQARGYFSQVIELDKSGEMGAWAALAMVRDQYLPARSDAAAELGPLKAGYAEVMEKYPGTPAAEEAFVYRAGLLVQTLTAADARQAIGEINAWLAGHSAAGQSRLKTGLYSLLSQAHVTLHQYPDALAAAIASAETKEIDPANPRENNILEYYRIGMMAQFDVGDFATARKYYGKFLAEYPRDQRAFTIQLMLKHLDETEASLRQGRVPKELSQIATESAPARVEAGP